MDIYLSIYAGVDLSQRVLACSIWQFTPFQFGFVTLSYTVRAEAQSTLARDAAYLVSHPNAKILIGGYCDERGSNEYNLALGQNRADSAKKVLVDAGVATSRIRVISYGKEKPFCTESTEACWQQNRRAGFTLDR